MAVRPGALSDPALSRLWDVVAKRLQDNGLVVRGTVTLEQLEQAERFALAGLLGRAVTAARARVDLVALDRRLCDSGTAPGLVAAANELRGPLVDRRGERAARAARKEAVWTAFGSRLGELGLDTE
ncbi:MAG: TIGR02679 domain-containing protein, partial [Acidimicrobiales bacterium]